MLISSFASQGERKRDKFGLFAGPRIDVLICEKEEVEAVEENASAITACVLTYDGLGCNKDLAKPEQVGIK